MGKPGAGIVIKDAIADEAGAPDTQKQTALYARQRTRIKIIRSNNPPPGK
jgi:hypothetical protein